jgi:hypothetical protein
MVNHSFVAVFFVLLLMPLYAAGQRAIGVDWDVSERSSDAATQLQRYADTGISHLRIHQPLNSETWELIDELGFTVFGQLPVNFPVAQSFAGADSARLDTLAAITAHYNRQRSVRAIGAFAYGAVDDEGFKRSLLNFTKDLSSKTDSPLYYLTADGKNSTIDSLFSFRMLRLPARTVPETGSIAAFIYRPTDSNQWDLASIKNALERTAASPQYPLFFEASWLRGMENRYPNFGQVLSTYTSSGNAVFPLPENSPKPFSKASAIAVMLLLAWVLFAVTYSYDPIYRKSFVRYFTGHRFFVDDVMKRHVRSPFTGGSILIQHAISGGIVIYIIFAVFFTSLGYEALLSHYPLLPEPDAGGLNFFFWGCLLTFVFQLISITWLRLALNGVANITQVINLYTWPLQLNLFTATLISLFFLSGPSQDFIFGLCIIFALLFALSFIITAADTGRFVRRKKIQYYAVTMGLYLFGLIGFVSWLFSSSSLQDVIELATSLP